MYDSSGEAVIHSCILEDRPFVFFHTSSEPYILKSLAVDDDWKTKEFGTFQLSFRPNNIRSYSGRPLVIAFSNIASSLFDISNGMEEVRANRFPFAIDDLVPSLYSTEFVYASPQSCSIYSVDNEKVSRNMHFTDEVFFQPIPVSLQPSSSPLVYYASHPNGIQLCDFRIQRPSRLSSTPRCVFLERIDEDWNHLIVALEDEVNIIDIRNPNALLMRWRYQGTLQKIRCLRCPSEYILLGSVRHSNRQQLLGDTFHRTDFDLSRDDVPSVLPTLHDDALQLIQVSPLPFAFSELPTIQASSLGYSLHPVCSVFTIGWTSQNDLSLKLSSMSTNSSMQHIFNYGESERVWTPPTTSVSEDKEELRSIHVDKLVVPRKEKEGDINELEKLVDSGLLAQPLSVDEIIEQLQVQREVWLSPEHVEAWLETRGMKKFVSSAVGEECCRYAGTVWIDPSRYDALTDPYSSLEHPIDRKRIETLESLWKV